MDLPVQWRHLRTSLVTSLGILAVVIGVAAPVFAQQNPSPPDAGFLQEGLQQELNRRDEQRLERERLEDGPVIDGADPSGDGKLPETNDFFVLNAIEFNDSYFLSEERLQRIASTYVDRRVSFAALNRMIGRVNDLYATEGIVTARAIIPPQRIQDGVLRVQLVEGRVGEVEISGQQHVSGEYVRSRITSLEGGEVLDVIALRESITRLNRTEELRAGASLRAGEEPGETDIRLQVQEPPRYTASVFADNHGSGSTGDQRVGVNLGMFSPFGFGDRLTLLALSSGGARNASIAYQFPVNRRAGRLEVRQTQGSIEIIEGPFSDLSVEGESSTSQVKFDQPLLRTDSLWRDFTLSASRSDSETTIVGQSLSEFTTDRISAGLRFTGFLPDKQWTFRQGFEYAQIEDVLGTGRNYWFLEGAGSFNAITTEDILLTLRGSWQWSRDDAVPSPLLFQAGGPSSVRGYSQGALAGARGYYANIEARYQGLQRLVPLAFFDYGYINDTSPDSESAFSLGVGMGWQGPSWLSAEVAIGVPLRDVEADQDAYLIQATISANWSGG
ncbi:ShlB/FhaC/HecB family hemolysin secretion/activation protein [Spiribacter vilamensis]|uniref:Hemolysin activation/secretion protein n=1 Tax=Spiribacter vilamensis TaxID=531306 RepID=A0A4Q8D2I4_9GAMM|nr:ShlB/FhaC/HecB family hemolysin secretion/activation protein [Spiribacter vilamensis]RZU99621.1 hemolysin activation/secretion protein [Spiribacter vilamensis]TVO61418.1 ShlB/FhaC/HecB family hemolysin secretion/activation protein [Spiribacter vilamensis]